jgi:hypothetical protein
MRFTRTAKSARKVQKHSMKAHVRWRSVNEMARWTWQIARKKKRRLRETAYVYAKKK